MCKNGRNRCSVWAALVHHGEAEEAARIFTRMVDKKEKQGGD